MTHFYLNEFQSKVIQIYYNNDDKLETKDINFEYELIVNSISIGYNSMT
jgi:hypothetical protein